MHRLADACILATGFRRIALAFLAGALGGLAMPPLGLSPVLFVCLPIAVWLIDGDVGASETPWGARLQGVRYAAFDGWWFGFGFHVAGLWWLGAAFLVEPDKFAWLMPLGVLGLPAVLALFSAFGFALARLAWFASPLRVFAFAAALTVAEVARANLLSGFPWNEWGMALGTHLWSAQAASLVGLHGLTVLALLIGALPAACVDGASVHRWRVWPLANIVALVVLVVGFGAYRASGPASPTLPGVKLRIVQPNVAQDMRIGGDAGLDLVRQYIELSDRATSPTTSGLADVTHLVWPESPFPFVLTQEPKALGLIATALAGRTVLLTGGVRLEGANVRTADAYNSLYVIGRNGQIAGTYDKVHLVPFGEYLPFGGFLRRIGLRQFIQLPGGFSPGAERRSVAVPGLPTVQPLICYEVIFPGQVMPSRPDTPRPGLMVNITNDAWFGITPGPHQHWAQARLRAVEEGIPLIRAANSGISGVIDGFGRVLGSLPLGTVGVLDAAVPRALPAPVYARFPIGAPFALWLLVAAAALAGAWQTARGSARSGLSRR